MARQYTDGWSRTNLKYVFFFFVLETIKLISLLVALFVRGYTLKRVIIRSDNNNADKDLENGESEAAAAEGQGEGEKGSVLGSKAGSGDAERDGDMTEHTAQGDVTEVKAGEGS